MSISQRMEVKQGQALVMTPQLQQAIKLLQLTNLELTEFVEEQLQENPFLERQEEEGPGEAAAAKNEQQDQQAGEQTAAPAADQSADHDMGDVADAGAGDWSTVRSRGPVGDDDYDPASNTAAEKSLHDVLTEQLPLAVTDHRHLLIGAHIIDLIDETGYLRAESQEIAATLGTTTVEVEAVVQTIQRFDPTGVGARTLSECLTAQWVESQEEDESVDALLAHLELLGKHDLAGLKKQTGLSDTDIADAVAKIRQLNPKPGLKYGSDRVDVLVPDVFVKEDADGTWKVELNADTLPSVIANERYFTKLSSQTKDTETRSFLNEHMSSANWLVKSLDQRARTILRVATEIVRYQDAFLVDGIQHLRPLNLKTIADLIDMHESTVSRVTCNKYIHTPRGVFEMKYFFTPGIASRDGEDSYSAETVRQRIKALIDDEDKAKPLSDDRIVTLLAEENIDIARRTVAKYREALDLPSSVQRRRMAQRLWA